MEKKEAQEARETASFKVGEETESAPSKERESEGEEDNEASDEEESESKGEKNADGEKIKSDKTKEKEKPKSEERDAAEDQADSEGAEESTSKLECECKEKSAREGKERDSERFKRAKKPKAKEKGIAGGTKKIKGKEEAESEGEEESQSEDEKKPAPDPKEKSWPGGKESGLGDEIKEPSEGKEKPESEEKVDGSRRKLIIAGALSLIVGGVGGAAIMYYKTEKVPPPEFTAIEDLTRVHGILNRALLVYREIAVRLLENPLASFAIGLNRTALLFRAFGQDYHEKMLEEAYVFPDIRKSGMGATSYVDSLQRQHDLGRQLTDQILSDTANNRIRNGTELSQTLIGFSRMYANHLAREDTIIFPAWRQTMSNNKYKSISRSFENVETEHFGKDGFEQAVNEMNVIEKALGLDDVTRFNPPTPQAPQRNQ